jgi:hypothetical protein
MPTDTEHLLRILNSIDEVPVRQFWDLVDPPPPDDIGNCVVGEEEVSFDRILWITNQPHICETIKASLVRVREAKEVVDKLSKAVFDSSRPRAQGDKVIRAGIVCATQLARLELYLATYHSMWTSSNDVGDPCGVVKYNIIWPHKDEPPAPAGVIVLNDVWLGNLDTSRVDILRGLDRIGEAIRVYAATLNDGVDIPPEVIHRLRGSSASNFGNMQARFGACGTLPLPTITNVSESQRNAVVAPLKAASEAAVALRDAKRRATVRRWTLVARAALVYLFFAASYAMVVERRGLFHYLHVTAAICTAAIAWSVGIDTKVKHELDGYVGGPDGAMVTAWRRFYVRSGMLIAAYLVVVFASAVFANNKAIFDVESEARYRVLSAIIICLTAFCAQPGQRHALCGGNS